MSISLSEILPPPTNYANDDAQTVSQKDWWFNQHKDTMALAEAIKKIPPYGAREGWVPRTPEDFADGGAYPEIHVAQYPLEMGKKDGKKQGAGTLALQLDETGKIRYDAIVRQGQQKDKVIYSKLSDMKGTLVAEDDPELQKPTMEEIEATTEKTREALEKITASKVSAALPVKRAEKQGPAQYIRYTPTQQGSQFNSGAKQRIIRMVETQRDPMSPPRFKINQKIPRGPPSPPAPVMHSPTRKTSVKEQAEWKIPPCISNWKNTKGYTIPLDKRLAADGRGLQQTHINENFAKLAESLYLADRKAREAVELRSQLEIKLAQKEKEEKEEKMRQMARRAREERAGIRSTGEKDASAKERDEFRRDREQERRREKNVARMAPDRRSKVQKDRERDISEQIALGIPDNKKGSNETRFDARLFDSSKGLDSGGGYDDEVYAAYDKPWRATDSIQTHVYRPSKTTEQDMYGGDLDKLMNTGRFVPAKGFAGAGEPSSSKRSGPVPFEKSGTTAEEEDPFGLGKFLDEAKRGHKRHAPEDDSEKKRRK